MLIARRQQEVAAAGGQCAAHRSALLHQLKHSEKRSERCSMSARFSMHATFTRLAACACIAMNTRHLAVAS